VFPVVLLMPIVTLIPVSRVPITLAVLGFPVVTVVMREVDLIIVVVVDGFHVIIMTVHIVVSVVMQLPMRVNLIMVHPIGFQPRVQFSARHF